MPSTPSPAQPLAEYRPFKKLSRWRFWPRPTGRAEKEGRGWWWLKQRGGSEFIFSSGLGHVTGVTSPNVVVGGGGERSRRSRRKDGGAVEEALPLLPPPLPPPPPAKPELEPQGVSAPHQPRPHIPWAPGTRGGAPCFCRRWPRAPRALAALRAPLPFAQLLVGPAPPGSIASAGAGPRGYCAHPSRPSHTGAPSCR